MPPRIAYWTSAFEPEIEAIASEVALLRRRYPGSIAWGLHPKQWSFSWRRGYCLNPRLHLLFRAATRVLESAFQINHVFGSLGDWFYLEGKRRRPVVLTMAAMTEPVPAALLEKVRRFVVEYPGGRDYLEKLGIPSDRVRLIFPPVDLERFVPVPPPDGPFTVLFASSPGSVQWLPARGVPQILEAAALRPRMRFRLLWRPWGDALEQVHRWVGERGLRNVEVAEGYWKNMPAQYARAHVTVAPFADVERAKPAPNSIVESLACGRPVVVTPTVGLAEMIEQANAGRVCGFTGADLVEALDRLQADWRPSAHAARALAERWFNVEQFMLGYQRIYDDVLRN